ncbi:hypothetical protein J7T55_014222 [Diaporthe amygdali]|uniref:uncharacterized protein n=1 Tax=Phomopsis amygdali TaxID=1214568 RepID=UPI0022FE261E|nr:uncharacterized protein J7T55_014222 [Diaporthe amygdali]KAJ0109660.1 hypothetical protein J7T55_014222 [Diaporthe amygdali]
MKSTQVPGIVSLVIPWMMSTTAIALRLLARRVTKTRLWWDDWMALLTYIWAVGNSAVGIKWVCDGLGLHLAEISWMSPSQSLKVAQMNLFFLALFYALAVGSAKLAVLALYWRMFSLGRLRYPIIVLATCSVLWIVIRATLGVVRCIPVYKYWDPSAPGRCPIDDGKLFPGGAFSHLTLDILIIALPLFELRKLRLSLCRKFGVMILFLFGFILRTSATTLIFRSSQTRSTMESRASVHPVSVLEDHEYYQVPVMIPETVFESPEQSAAEDLCLCEAEHSDDLRSRYGLNRDVQQLGWDIWAGPGENSTNVLRPPPAVYPGDANLQDNHNLRFLTVHDIV